MTKRRALWAVFLLSAFLLALGSAGPARAGDDWLPISQEELPLGYLPATLQANYGLVVTDQGGELVQLPLLPPTTNRLTRVAKLSLSSTGTLSGEVQEVRWGEPAVSRRGELLEATGSERVKVLEGFLANSLGGFKLTRAEVDNLEKFDENLVLRYHFVA